MKNWKKYLSLVLAASFIGSALTPAIPVRAEQAQEQTVSELPETTSVRKYDFESGKPSVQYYDDAKGNTISYTDGIVKIERSASGAPFINFGTTAEEQDKINQGFMISYDLRLDEMGNKIWGLQAKNSDWHNGQEEFYILTDGTIQMSSGTKFGTFPTDGAFHNLTFAFDYTDGKVTCYIDGAKAGEAADFHKEYIYQEFRVGVINGGSATTISIDNFEIALLKNASSEETTEGGEIFKNVTFSDKVGYGLNQNGETLEVRSTDEDEKYLYIDNANGKNCHIAYSIGAAERAKMTEKKGYVADFDIFIEKKDAGAKVLVFAGKDSIPSFFNMQCEINAAGKLSIYNGPENKNYIFGDSVIETGKWYRISFVFDQETMKVSAYIDGEKLENDAAIDEKFFDASEIRQGAINNQKITVKIDNFRLYQGTALRTPQQDAEENPGEIEEDVIGNFETVLDTAEDALALIGQDDLAVMVNNGAYIYQKNKSVSDVKPYLDGETVMIPENIADLCFSQVLGQTTAVTKDGVKFYSLQELCQKASRYFSWDDRGFAVASVAEFTLKNSSAVEVIDEPIDVLYRYMQFERPDGKTIAAAIKEKNPDKSHPRLVTTPEKLEALKENVKTNETLKTWAGIVIESADGYIQKGTVDYKLENSTPPKMWSQGRTMWERMLNYALAYEFTGEDKYVAAAWRDVENVCETYPDWNQHQHFLDTAEMSFAMAIAYDMFYNEFTAEQLAMIRQASIKNGLKAGVKAYSGATDVHGYWVDYHTNWTSVCPGGLMSLAIAMCDEEDTAPYCEILLGQTLQSFENIFSMFYPDGVWPESMYYMSYTTLFIWAGIGSLTNAVGTDYGMFDAPGAKKMAESMLNLHGKAEGAFNFHNGSAGMQINGAMLWIANYLGIEGFQNEYMTLRETVGTSSDPEVMNLFAYDPSMEGKEGSVPLDSYYRTAEVGIMRQGTGVNDIWAAVHAGPNGTDHSQMDLGEFVFEAYGVRWVTDLGADSYVGNYLEKDKFTFYRKRAEANNCLVINPDESGGQTINCTTGLTKQESASGGSMMVFDLTPAYDTQAASVTRGFLLGDDRRSFTIRDEITGLKKESNEIYWFMNLSDEITDIKIDKEHKSAVFKTDSGQQLNLSFWTDAEEYEIDTMACVPLPTSATDPLMKDDSNRTKLYIKMKASDSVSISVKLVPQMGYTGDITAADASAISDWTVKEMDQTEKPLAEMITLNGQPLADFKKDNFSYTTLWLMNEDFPTVAATCADKDVKITVTQPKDWKNPAVIRLENTKTGKISEYRIIFKMEVSVEGVEGYEDLEVKSLTASDEQITETQRNVKENVLDGDIITRWSAEAVNGNPQWLTMDLGEVKRFDGIKLSFYLGAVRTTTFGIEISEDGESFESIFFGESSGTTEQCEVYTIAGTARYIRFVGYKNSQGTWISVNECHPVIKKTADPLPKPNDPEDGTGTETGTGGSTNDKDKAELVGTYQPAQKAENTKNQTTAAKTGDSSSAMLFAIVMLCAAGALELLKKRNRKIN